MNAFDDKSECGSFLGEIVLYNIFYEVSSLCTSVVAEDQNGKVIHGRSLDFGLLMGLVVSSLY